MFGYTHEKFEVKELKDVDINTINKFELPDYVYDKHTAKGNKDPVTKDYNFFIDNIVLIPRYGEEETWIEKEGKRLYKEVKKPTRAFLDPFPESVVMKHYPPANTKLLDTHKYIQTQLITARHKPKVYYWDYKDDGTYSKVIKGPMKRWEYERYAISDKIKGDTRIKRVHCKYTEGWMISRNLIKVNPEECVKKSSKIEPEVVIYSGNTFGCNKDTINESTEVGKIDWLKCLAFRKFIGTNDTCFRNFLCVNGHVYTIDDPYLGNYTTEFMFKTKLNPKIADQFMKALTDNWKVITEWLDECEITIGASTSLTERQKQPMLEQIGKLKIVDNWKF